MRLVNGRLQRFIGVADLVETFVALAHAVENRNRFLFRGWRDFYCLKAPLKRAIFFNRLAKLSRRGGANALEFTARERRFQNVGGVERALSRTSPDQRVKLIDKDDVLRVLHQLAHDLFQALFKLSAILCARNYQRKIERQDALVLEKRRHFTTNYPLRQPFNDRGLAYARFANQHRIILGAPAKYLHHSFDLGFATD